MTTEQTQQGGDAPTRRVPDFLRLLSCPLTRLQAQTTVGGSDINILASADEERITRLWEEKCGLTEPRRSFDGLACSYGLGHRGAWHCLV